MPACVNRVGLKDDFSVADLVQFVLMPALMETEIKT